MIIPTKIKGIGVSLIKKNNKISMNLARINEENNKVDTLLEADSDFPFNNPLVTKDSVKIYEFIIEANNYAVRVSNL